ncbi:hypothetical protein BIY27_00040 [Gibbsiella quercinecans]|uniref:MoaF-related domain-containing protein n=1 Tax=Gibbsiella quercinecans TaxID=929813 RepID=UPI000EF1F246|nr:MoaF C-terminal domain-containing protein [Gibbsiella quercinecans]RLM16514.1 hypothetical protein BIY27_00040 [Gibbsiella quercinecans]
MKTGLLLTCIMLVSFGCGAASHAVTDGFAEKTRKRTETNMSQKSFFSQKKIQWEWTEGAYAGAIYENVFNDDGTMVWKGLKGAEKNQSRTERYVAYNISDDVSAASWFEPTEGATVNVILNFKSSEIYGFISDKDDRVALKGKFSVLQ